METRSNRFVSMLFLDLDLEEKMNDVDIVKPQSKQGRRNLRKQLYLYSWVYRPHNSRELVTGN